MTAGRDMQNVVAGNRCLVSEVSALRAQIGAASTLPVDLKRITAAMARLMEVENEVFGTALTAFENNRTGGSVEPSDKGNEAVTGGQDFSLFMGNFVPSIGHDNLTSMTEQDDLNAIWAAPPEVIPTSWNQESEILWDYIPWLYDTIQGYIA